MWEVSSGRRVRFWSDCWIGEKPLVHRSTSILSPEQLSLTVDNYWQEGRGWTWENISPFLQATDLMLLASKIIMPEAMERDSFKWMEDKGGICTVSSAYDVFVGRSREEVWGGWSLVWRLRVQSRIKIFLWLMIHEGLMTNKSRWRRGIAQSPICSHCGEAQEDSLHAIRDCRYAREVWELLLPINKKMEFFKDGLQRWISANLSPSKSSKSSPPWPKTMAVTCWHIWKWRNQLVFKGEHPPLWIRRARVVSAIAESNQAWGLGAFSLIANSDQAGALI